MEKKISLPNFIFYFIITAKFEGQEAGKRAS